MLKEKQRLFSFGLVLIAVFAIFLSTASSCLAAQYYTTQLTNRDNVKGNPQISGNNIVWNGSDGHDSEIFFYNGSTVTTLTNNGRPDYYPQVSDDNVVWEGRVVDGYRHLGWQIFFFNGSSTVQLTDNGGNRSPQISGNNIVWHGSNLRHPDIFFYNGSTTIQLTNSGDNRSPQISGNNIVWEGNDGNDDEIFFYNGSSTVQLTNDNYDDINTQISGNNVVWQGYEGGNDWEIFFYNGSSTVRLTDNSYDDRDPQISGNNVVWYSHDGDDWEIFFYNGSSTVQLTDNSYDDYNPKVSGNNVVWQGGDFDDQIFYYNGSTTVQLTDNRGNGSPQISGNSVVWLRSGWHLSEILLGGPDPKVSLVAPFVSTKISKRPTFKVSWSANDPVPSSGKHLYTVRYRWANSKTWKNWKTNAKSTYGLFQGTAGRTVFFRVKAKDEAGNVGWSKVRRTIIPYNEGANVRKKIGFNGYQKSGRSSNYLTSVRYSYKQGHTLVYRLDNTNGIGLVTTKSSNRGRAKIYVDGKYIKTVDAFSAKHKPRQLIFYKGFKTKGTHYLKIVNQGTPGRARFDVDAVVAGR